MTKLNIGVVGATGLVGEVFLRLLEERELSIGELRLFASDRSVGQKLKCAGKDYSVRALDQQAFKDLDLVFFSSGDNISKEWAPQAVAAGAFAIDNSAAFRMDPKIPLIVPEVNGHLIPARSKPSIIANPNCSTIQLVVALKPLLERFGLESVHVASYQAVSGAGRPARDELLQQVKLHSQGLPISEPQSFPHQIAFNVIPQIGSFNEQGFSSEEWKIIHETKKILGTDKIRVSAMTVRVPVLNAHSEAVWVRLNKKISREEILQCIRSATGLKLLDNPHSSQYPLALQSADKDEVFVGRIHQDIDDPLTWILWIVADNLRKGAALNGIQIAEHIFGAST